MRQVEVSHYVREEQPGEKECGGGIRVIHVLKPKGLAKFHEFGVSYEEFDTGPGNYSTAIIEWPNGEVENVPVELIRFTGKDFL